MFLSFLVLIKIPLFVAIVGVWGKYDVQLVVVGVRCLIASVGERRGVEVVMDRETKLVLDVGDEVGYGDINGL